MLGHMRPVNHKLDTWVMKSHRNLRAFQKQERREAEKEEDEDEVEGKKKRWRRSSLGGLWEEQKSIQSSIVATFLGATLRKSDHLYSLHDAFELFLKI